MMRKPVRMAIVLTICVGGLLPASADVVTLNDGSKLLGKVVRLQEGKLTLETAFAGTLEIDAALIETVATEDPVNVAVDTGDRLVGSIEWRPEIERAVVQSELGGIPVDVTRIDAIWPKDAKSPEVLAMEQQIEQVKAEAEAAQAKWSATIEAGLLFQEGNTDVFTARGRVELRRKSTKDLLRLYLTGEYGEENDQRNTHEVKSGAYYEYLFTERLFGYGQFELEYDEFENLDLRLSTAVGVGYYWIKEDDHELKTRGGLGYLHETYFDGTTEDAAQADLGLDYRLDIAPWMQFTHSMTYYPTFDSIRDYRLISDSAFLFPLGSSEVWKLKLGALYEYRSMPAAGAERLDQTYYANILIDLK